MRIQGTHLDALFDYLSCTTLYVHHAVHRGAFYLNPLKTPKAGCWYSNAPVGKNKLATAVATMCSECGILGYKTNHSLRATAATRLYASGIDEQLVMKRTGHRSIEGIRSYKRTSLHQKEAVSDILSNMSTKKHCGEVSAPEPPAVDTHASMPSNTANISIPNYSSKSGAIYFSNCTNININFNTAQ